MGVVIDASVTVTWFFDDEVTRATEAVLNRVTEDSATVPTLWPLEVASALQTAIRRKRITALHRDRSLAQLAQMPITTDTETNTYAWTTTLRLAERFSLTLYDSAYLELAQRLSLPLATLDRDLREAAAAVGVELLGSES